MKKMFYKTMTAFFLTGSLISGVFLFATSEDVVKHTKPYKALKQENENNFQRLQSELDEKESEIDKLESFVKKYDLTDFDQSLIALLVKIYTNDNGTNYSAMFNDWQALALNIYHEGGITSLPEQYMIGHNTVNNAIDAKTSIKDAVYARCGNTMCYSWTINGGLSRTVSAIHNPYMLVALKVLTDRSVQSWNFGQVKYYNEQVIAKDGRTLKQKGVWHNDVSRGCYVRIINQKIDLHINKTCKMVEIGQINICGLTANNITDDRCLTYHSWFIDRKNLSHAVEKLKKHNLFMFKQSLKEMEENDEATH
jgi:hypothetical protein